MFKNYIREFDMFEECIKNPIIKIVRSEPLYPIYQLDRNLNSECTQTISQFNKNAKPWSHVKLKPDSFDIIDFFMKNNRVNDIFYEKWKEKFEIVKNECVQECKVNIVEIPFYKRTWEYTDYKKTKSEIYQEAYNETLKKLGPGMRIFSGSIINHLIFAVEDSWRTVRNQEYAEKKAKQIADEWEMNKINAENERDKYAKMYTDEVTRVDQTFDKKYIVIITQLLKEYCAAIVDAKLVASGYTREEYTLFYNQDEAEKILLKSDLNKDDIITAIKRVPSSAKPFVAAAAHDILDKDLIEYFDVFAPKSTKAHIYHEIVSFLSNIYEQDKNLGVALVNEKNESVIKAAKEFYKRGQAGITWEIIANKVYGYSGKFI